MNAAAFEAAKQQERAAGEDGTFFTLVYNEQHKPAAQWFQERDWQVSATPLPGLLTALGRPVPAVDSAAGQMTGNITLVSAIKPR